MEEEAQDTENEGKLDILNPAFVMAIIAAVASDAVIIVSLFGLLLPGIGLILAGAAVIFHYFAGFIVAFMIFPKAKGWLANLVLGLSLVLPLPTLTIGIVLTILCTNSVLRFVTEQLAIQAIALVSAGFGEALELAEVGEVAVEGAEFAVEAAEITEGAAAGTEAVETGEAAAGAGGEEAGAGAETGEGATEGGRPSEKVTERQPQAGKPSEAPALEPEEGIPGEKPEVSPEALGEQRELLGEKGKLQKELFEEAPKGEAPKEPEAGDAEEAKKKAAEKAKKVVEIAKKTGEAIERLKGGGEEKGQGEEEKAGEEEEDEDLPKAA